MGPSPSFGFFVSIALNAQCVLYFCSTSETLTGHEVLNSGLQDVIFFAGVVVEPHQYQDILKRNNNKDWGKNYNKVVLVLWLTTAKNKEINLFTDVLSSPYSV